MRDIRVLIEQCRQDFIERNFALNEYTDPIGRRLPMYNVFFDGFILLVMGYTGPKALQLKVAYIEAFNAMRDRLSAADALPAPGLSQAEIAAKLHAFKENLCAGLTSDKRYAVWNAIGARFKHYLGTRDFTEIRADQLAEAKRLMSVPIGEKVANGPRKSCKTPLANKMASFRQQLSQTGHDVSYSYTEQTDTSGTQRIIHTLTLTEMPA